ncbi:MAG: phytanoyl-CoA dioxygenase family protein [Blastocatellia bacterium]
MAQQIERTVIDGSYRLADDQVAEIRRRGCGVLRGVLSGEEMDGHRPVLRDYVMAKREAMSAIEQAVGASPTETIFSLETAPRSVVDLVTSPRLGEIAARVLGVEAVRLLHFSGFFKPSGGPGTPWHQDLTYMPLNTDKVVSIWIPLTDITQDMGGLLFAEGSHLQGELMPFKDVERFQIVQHGPMQAGDASLHMGWTIHSSLPNSSARMREVITIGYYADGTRIQKRGEVPIVQSFLDTYFAGLKAGDLAEGPLNPVVFRFPA